MLVEAKSIINHLQERASLLNGQEVTSLVLKGFERVTRCSEELTN